MWFEAVKRYSVTEFLLDYNDMFEANQLDKSTINRLLSLEENNDNEVDLNKYKDF